MVDGDRGHARPSHHGLQSGGILRIRATSRDACELGGGVFPGLEKLVEPLGQLRFGPGPVVPPVVGPVTVDLAELAVAGGAADDGRDDHEGRQAPEARPPTQSDQGTEGGE